MIRIALLSLLAAPAFAAAQFMPNPVTELEGFYQLYVDGAITDEQLVELYHDGFVMYEDLPDYLQPRVLSIVDSYEPMMTEPMPTMKMKKRVLVRPTKTTTNELMGDNFRKEIRSARQMKQTRFRPFEAPNFVGSGMQTRADLYRGDMMDDAEKTYITRRSYYYYDQRDMQAADLIRLRNRMRMMNGN